MFHIQKGRFIKLVPVKRCPFIKSKRLVKTIDCEAVGAVYVFQDVVGRIGSYDSYLIFSKGIFFYSEMIYSNGICKNKAERYKDQDDNKDRFFSYCLLDKLLRAD